ncbi:MAG: DUF805 domain-containing protein [Ruminococcus sp.]|nr:DUF805 domain-containing protein [Ruminococcus sp.]
MNNYIHMLQTAFTFYGRERRQVYWSATLTNLGILLVFILIFGSIKTISWIAYLYVILTIIPQIAITVRRLHDVNSSGKKLLLLLIPVVGLILIIIELTLDSTPDTNIYGESLKYPKDNEVVLSPDAIAKPKKVTLNKDIQTDEQPSNEDKNRVE